MIELTHEQLLNDTPPAGLTPRLVPLVARCTALAGQCTDPIGDAGLRFAIVTGTADLRSDGALATFLGDTDLLAGLLFRMEGCHRWAEERAYLLVLSISEAGADYLVFPDEYLPLAWLVVMNDLHATEEPAV